MVRLARAFAILNLLFAILGMLSLAPISAHAQNPGRDDGETGEGVYAGRVVVLGAVVELPALDAPAPRRQPRCRPRPRLLSPMLLAHTGLQLADAHSTLRGLAAGAVEANPSPIAQWAVRSSARAYGVSAAATGLTWWGAGVIACHYPRPALWTVVALNGLYAVVVTHNYRLGSTLLAR